MHISMKTARQVCVSVVQTQTKTKGADVNTARHQGRRMTVDIDYDENSHSKCAFSHCRVIMYPVLFLGVDMCTT